MPVSINSRLGRYEILSRIGAGGRGEVYRARDTRLGRDVAIKVLPEAFVRDRERMARFGREAKFLAALNHPNIAAIYGVEDAGSTDALVMELAEGPTLADREFRYGLRGPGENFIERDPCVVAGFTFPERWTYPVDVKA
jgi:serine/threonine protein kinase